VILTPLHAFFLWLIILCNFEHDRKKAVYPCLSYLVHPLGESDIVNHYLD